MKSINAVTSHLLSLLFLAVFGIMLSSCGGSSGSSATTTPAPTLEEIQILIEEEILVAGILSQAHVAALYSDNTSQDLSNEATWFSSNPAVAYIDPNGAILAIQPGTTVITAAVISQNKKAFTQLTVKPGGLISINVIPTNVELPQGVQQQYIAMGQFSNGATNLSFDMTAQITWSSSDINKITISNAVGSRGLATALAIGTADINATIGGSSGSTQVSVTAASLSRIEISAAQTSVPAGNKLQLKATGIYLDNSVFDLSSQVNWSTSNENIATIDSNGLLTTHTAGTVEISLSFQGQTASFEIDVSDATLTRIEVSPSNERLTVGETLQLHTTAIYSDGSKLNITDQTTWISSEKTIATVGNTSLNDGIVTAVTAGSTIIFAYFDDQTANTTLTVTTASLDEIIITPSDPNIAVGTQQGFSATGSYDDGSTRDLTEQVTWSSSDNSVAEEQSEVGYFKGIASGTTRITASFNDVSAFSDLTVTAATFNNISLTPTSQSIAKGLTLQYVATGHFPDNSTQDITRSVIWQSSDTAVASISNSDETKGLLTSITSGSATISASFSVITNSASITVTEAELSSISIQLNSNQMEVGTQQILTATGHYSDNTTLDITSQATWSSSNDSIASVSNTNNSEGKLIALSAGSVNISASLDEISGSASLTISEDPNAPVSLSIYATPNVILNDASDPTAITVILHPSSSSGSIADNTEINIQITEGENTLPNQTIYTSAGSANFPFSTNYTGIINVQATVAGSSISQSSNIYATANFANVITNINLMSVQPDNNTVLAGSWFTLIVQNLSNRTFTINQYEFINGAVSSIDPGSNISGGELSGGEDHGVFVPIFVDQPDNGISGILTLTDPDTGQQFTITAVFTSP